MGFFGKQLKKGRGYLKEEFKRSAEIKKIERESLHEARLKQAKVYGTKRAAAETKLRLSPKKQQNAGGFGALAEGMLGTPKKGKGKVKDINDFI